MDLILDRFLTRTGAALDEEARRDLDRLLDQSDQEILDWIQRRSAPPDPGLAALVDRIRDACTPAGDGRLPVLHEPRMAAVEIGGADAAAFLHAQLTSDVASMPVGGVALSAWCNSRGQVRNLFWIVRRASGTEFLLAAPSTEADSLVQGLRGFILRAKVRVERNEDRVLGATGPDSDAFIAGWVGSVPPAGHARESGPRLAFRPPGEPTRFLIVGRDPLVAQGSEAAWRRSEIEAGIAWLTEISRESFIPQILNLDRLGAVSFEKGCYPGQEIIARTRYLGRLKRRLYRAMVGGGPPPAPGAPVRDGDRTVGTILAAERDERNEGYELLAVLRTDHAGARLRFEDGRHLRVSHPPA